ncbi:MAG: mechanosensitive ion channel family protein [Acidobacteriota bacterium]|nr:mechanosensitive ion channel family protein [Acidobacteriota bacterium]
MDSLAQSLQDLREKLGPILENAWGHAALIVVGSLIAAKVADWIITHLIQRVTGRTKTDIDDRVIEALHRPIFVSVMLLGLASLPEVLEPPELVASSSLNILQTIAILMWAVVSMRIVHIVLTGLSRLRDRSALFDDANRTLLRNVASVMVYGGAVYFMLITWSINAGPWIASAGIAGIAVGFAAKDTLANLFAGVFILVDKPYRIGDFVNLADGQRGMVTEIGLRSTRLLTRDDIEITVPNSIIGQETIVNETGGPSAKSRVRLKVSVAYGSDVDQVQDLLMSIAIGHDEVCGEPEPRVRFRAFGDSSLDFELLCWIEEPVMRGRILHELHGRTYKELNATGIEIPFPQRDVHVVAAPPDAGT